MRPESEHGIREGKVTGVRNVKEIVTACGGTTKASI
jgi:hypothetical protein